ncbi:hypothetical protein [Faecalibacter rhinopitheci]|uniref:Uncharacterized protein n=1 Tax=Faecalibacter rhinopitheci TaxID=2779678 RepID=A0A8J7KB42_9FLAO|nr:hypothetical protein [Faecalibacter rhinopitheci]MBF0598210.1 hypothetical protein [Faecalibacter rhinopitheci]
MKKGSLILFLLILMSCNNNYNKNSVFNTPDHDNVSNSSKIISYKLISNYFVKNSVDVKKIEKSYIDNSNDFNAIFEKAKSLDKPDESASINFSKEFVIPIILEKTNIGTTIQVDSVLLNGNLLNVYYTVTEVQPISYIIQPNQLIIIQRDNIQDFNQLKLKFEKTTTVL